MVTEAHLQPDYVQNGSKFIDNLQILDSRFVNNSSLCRSSVFMTATPLDVCEQTGSKPAAGIGL